ncbi:twin-arginine translocation signal domain-containing protein [Haladaptatus pallidirubidus]
MINYNLEKKDEITRRQVLKTSALAATIGGVGSGIAVA